MLIFPVELPDKTFVAALVLSTRYRPLAVWIGVGLAFGVQCLVAVTAGQAVSFLPEWIVHALSTLMFLVGAIILLRQAPKADAEEKEQEEEFAREGDPGPEGVARGADVVPRPVRCRVGRPVADPHPQPGGEVRLAGLGLLRVVGRRC